jgi:PAS domain S-box-containing protein
MENLDLLKIVFNRLSMGLLVADQHGKILFFNPEAERILGVNLPEGDLAVCIPSWGCYRADMVTPYLPGESPFDRAVRGEEVLHELLFLQNPRQPAGAWINTSTLPFVDTVGVMRGGIVVLHDITEAQDLCRRKVAAIDAAKNPAGECIVEVAHVLERFARFRGVYDQMCRALEQTADTVFITNRQGVIEYINPAFEQTTGYVTSEVIGKTPKVLKSGYHDAEFYRILWDRLMAGEPFRGTIVNRKKSGELYWSDQTITPMLDEDQQITHFVSVLKDATDLRKRHEQEFYLGLAKEVQQRFYNPLFPAPGFDVAGAAFPSDQTGGDYFDFISQPGGSAYVVIGDVTGHGFGAALLMAETRAYVQSFAKYSPDLTSLFDHVNRSLAEDVRGGEQYVTLLVAHLDPRKRTMEYSSAGHESCYLLGSSGDVLRTLESMGPPLGLFPDSEYASSEIIPLNQGDTVVLLTDGVSEAVNHDWKQFGAERVLEFIRQHQRESSQGLVQGLRRAIREFSGGEPQHDDITMVICKVNPP